MNLLQEAAELSRRGERFALATVVWRQGPSSGKTGNQAIITEEGKLRGWIGGACSEPVVIRTAREVLHSGHPQLVLLGTPDEFASSALDGMAFVPISCQSEGALEVYIEPVLPAPHLMVVGTSPMTHTLAKLAEAMDWRVDHVGGDAVTGVTADSMVVIATQGHNDEEALERALAADPAYVGVVCSPKRGEVVLGYLADRGVPKDRLDKVQIPAGMDLGPLPHTEIAVALLAELVRLRAAGEVGKVPELPAEPETATDPVCGMTVDVTPDALRLDHNGTTYYFCAAGCRRAFERDSAAYLEETPC